MVPINLRPEGCAASLRITFIGIEKSGFVESPAQSFGFAQARRSSVARIERSKIRGGWSRISLPPNPGYGADVLRRIPERAGGDVGDVARQARGRGDAPQRGLR